MKWISVKDSMPTEDMGDVLIYTVKWGDIERAGDCHYVAGYMEWTGEHWESSPGVKYDEDACNYMVITHWMDVGSPFTPIVTEKSLTVTEIRKKLLQMNPQIIENSKTTNPFLYQDVEKWYEEL